MFGLAARILGTRSYLYVSGDRKEELCVLGGYCTDEVRYLYFRGIEKNKLYVMGDQILVISLSRNGETLIGKPDVESSFEITCNKREKDRPFICFVLDVCGAIASSLSHCRDKRRRRQKITTCTPALTSFIGVQFVIFFQYFRTYTERQFVCAQPLLVQSVVLLTSDGIRIQAVV